MPNLFLIETELFKNSKTNLALRNLFLNMLRSIFFIYYYLNEIQFFHAAKADFWEQTSQPHIKWHMLSTQIIILNDFGHRISIL